MIANYGAYYNLAERINNTFPEIDSDICTYLRNNDSAYADMWQEVIRLQTDFPVIPKVTEGNGAISLSTEEHKALTRYLELKNDMENQERKQIYICGHMDNTAYLKQIAGLHID